MPLAGTVSVTENVTSNTADIKAASNYHVDNYLRPLALAQIVLGGIIGTYGFIKQNQIANSYLNLAKEQVAQSDRLVGLSEKNYAEISKVTFDCQKAEFVRFTNSLSSRETEYMLEAFRYKEFTPDYKAQEGRAVANVSLQFDRAFLNRKRSTGKYATGRSCSDATEFAIEKALAMTVAADGAYRYEDQRKERKDQIYFERMTRGAGLTADIGNRVVSGLNGGASVATSGFAQITGAFNQRSNAFSSLDSAFSNKGNIFGSLANFGFQNVGQGAGSLSASGLLLKGGATTVGDQGGAFGGSLGAAAAPPVLGAGYGAGIGGFSLTSGLSDQATTIPG